MILKISFKDEKGNKSACRRQRANFPNWIFQQDTCHLWSFLRTYLERMINSVSLLASCLTLAVRQCWELLLCVPQQTNSWGKRSVSSCSWECRGMISCVQDPKCKMKLLHLLQADRSSAVTFQGWCLVTISSCLKYSISSLLVFCLCNLNIGQNMFSF